MLVVSVESDRRLVVIHYTTQEGRDSLDGLPKECADCLLAATAVSAAAVSRPFVLGEIKEESIPINLAYESIDLLTYSHGEAVNTGMDAVRKARTKLGETEYNIFFNNCESFVNWAIIEKRKSNQGEVGMMVTAGITVGVVGAVALGIAALFGGKKDKKWQTQLML